MIKAEVGLQDRSRLEWLVRRKSWLTDVTRRLNSMQISWEELWYNLHLRYSLMLLDLPKFCNGCRKKFTIDHTLLFPKVGLVMSSHDDAAKEWWAIGTQGLTPSDISYNPM